MVCPVELSRHGDLVGIGFMGLVWIFSFLAWLTDETFELESHYSRLTLRGTDQVDPIW